MNRAAVNAEATRGEFVNNHLLRGLAPQHREKDDRWIIAIRLANHRWPLGDGVLYLVAAGGVTITRTSPLSECVRAEATVALKGGKMFARSKTFGKFPCSLLIKGLRLP